MLDLVAAVYGRYAAVRIAPRGGRGCCVVRRRIRVSGCLGAVLRLRCSFAVIRDGCVGLRRRGLCVVHAGVCGENVSQAVPGVGLWRRARFHGCGRNRRWSCKVAKEVRTSRVAGCSFATQSQVSDLISANRRAMGWKR